MPPEFFVGYLEAPPETRRRLRRAALALIALAIVAAVVLAWATGPFDRTSFEFATLRDFEGTIEAQPVPVLIAPGGARFPLVLPGKHGAAAAALPFDGAAVALRAKRIVRGDATMLEVDPASIARKGNATPPVVEAPGAEVTVSGEIVDSKCFLGVMNPGRLEVHRACALRCIAGGIPPMLFAHDADGREARYLLLGSGGEPINDRVLPYVARPVEISGRVAWRDGLAYLHVDSIRDSKTR